MPKLESMQLVITEPDLLTFPLGTRDASARHHKINVTGIDAL